MKSAFRRDLAFGIMEQANKVRAYLINFLNGGKLVFWRKHMEMGLFWNLAKTGENLDKIKAPLSRLYHYYGICVTGNLRVQQKQVKGYLVYQVTEAGSRLDFRNWFLDILAKELQREYGKKWIDSLELILD